MTRFRNVNPLARWQLTQNLVEKTIKRGSMAALQATARDTNMAQKTQHPNDGPKTATGMAKIPVDTKDTVANIESARQRKTARAMVRDQVADLCQRITDDPQRGLRARLLRIDDLTPNQRVAAMQRVIDAATESLKELRVEPAKVVAANDRVADLEL